jgi:glycosyltransferase involved in cell wall biosynthesis
VAVQERKQSGTPRTGNLSEHAKELLFLCTYNRCESLARALESVAATIVSDGDSWEILVVDNNSKGRTREVVEDFCRRDPDHFR